MNREEAINVLYGMRADNLNLDDAYTKDKYDALEMAIKALERESKKYERERHCDCCGVLLTEENNKCGYELCDECNEELERYIAEKENRKKMSEIPTGSERGNKVCNQILN